MQKKAEFKLPQITKSRESINKHLSNTISEPPCSHKLRPASLNKVQDLQKKLFSKLDQYEQVTKKTHLKKPLRKKNQQIQNVKLEGEDNYEKMQKLMPQLYSKLVQAKKGSTHELNLTNMCFQPSPINFKSQKKIASKTAEETRRSLKSKTFLTSKQLQQQQPSQKDQQGQFQISQKQMQEYYKQYSLRQGFTKQTSNEQIRGLSEDINVCESEISNLKKSMMGLIQEIGFECIESYKGSINELDI